MRNAAAAALVFLGASSLWCSKSSGALLAKDFAARSMCGQPIGVVLIALALAITWRGAGGRWQRLSFLVALFVPADSFYS